MIPARPPVQSPPPVPISRSKLLLVEGNTPMHFFEAFLVYLGIGDQVEIRNFGSLSRLRPELPALVAAAGFQQLVRSVGIIRDAEDDAGRARQSVQDALTAAGLTPQRIPPVSTAIFILPDNQRPGMIETLCMEGVASDPTLADAFACVQEFFACLRQRQIALPADITFAKHHAQAYLATRPQVQLFPGLAAHRGYWPWDSPAFDPLRAFLRAL